METPPNPPLIDKYAACLYMRSHLVANWPMKQYYSGVCRLVRNILADKPRVTRFPVDFDAVSAVPAAKPAEALVAGATEMEA